MPGQLLASGITLEDVKSIVLVAIQQFQITTFYARSDDDPRPSVEDIPTFAHMPWLVGRPHAQAVGASVSDPIPIFIRPLMLGVGWISRRISDPPPHLHQFMTSDAASLWQPMVAGVGPRLKWRADLLLAQADTFAEHYQICEQLPTFIVWLQLVGDPVDDILAPYNPAVRPTVQPAGARRAQFSISIKRCVYDGSGALPDLHFRLVFDCDVPLWSHEFPQHPVYMPGSRAAGPAS
ncbi:hypothetical protein JCM10908_003257 [Rhodotorula pacifica]|uniref:uncharacterized protein n=1 Tax=Rhodotorula pacifica TaxID=1495444 RepID=UPI00317679C0